MTDGARFDDPDQKRAFAAYLDAAVELDGPEIATIIEAARDHRVFTYLGIAERGTGPGRGTRLLHARSRSIPSAASSAPTASCMPTYEERLAWGIGDGHGLRVHDGPGGVPASAASTAGRTGCRWPAPRCTRAARTSTSRSGRVASA